MTVFVVAWFRHLGPAKAVSTHIIHLPWNKGPIWLEDPDYLGLLFNKDVHIIWTDKAKNSLLCWIERAQLLPY